MDRDNNLSRNLKIYQQLRGKSLSELSKELGIPKSTLYTAIISGNTMLDTAIRMANSMEITLDELVFERSGLKKYRGPLTFLQELGWYAELPKEKQEKIRKHVDKILEILSK